MQAIIILGIMAKLMDKPGIRMLSPSSEPQNIVMMPRLFLTEMLSKTIYSEVVCEKSLIIFRGINRPKGTHITTRNITNVIMLSRNPGFSRYISRINITLESNGLMATTNLLL